MTTPKCTPFPDTSPGFFERLYRGSDDPWNFRHSTYERARYQAIVEAINDKHYKSAFEPGCAVGELTALLAPYCDSLQAIDCSDTAVKVAMSRCCDYPQVMIRQGILPHDLPVQRCDLIVFSEVGYYFPLQELVSLITKLWALLAPGGRLVACHWLGHSEDHELHGTVVHQAIEHVLRSSGDFKALDNGYTLQRWSK